jgi:hypothetical protein
VVGDVAAVLPVESDLVLRDRDGSERRNRARFDDCHRYSGSATVRYDGALEAPGEKTAVREALKRGQRVEMKFESGIGEDVAIGDVFTFGAAKVRVTDVRQVGDRWNVEFSLVGRAVWRGERYRCRRLRDHDYFTGGVAFRFRTSFSEPWR